MDSIVHGVAESDTTERLSLSNKSCMHRDGHHHVCVVLTTWKKPEYSKSEGRGPGIKMLLQSQAAFWEGSNRVSFCASSYPCTQEKART